MKRSLYILIALLLVPSALSIGYTLDVTCDPACVEGDIVPMSVSVQNTRQYPLLMNKIIVNDETGRQIALHNAAGTQVPINQGRTFLFNGNLGAPPPGSSTVYASVCLEFVGRKEELLCAEDGKFITVRRLADVQCSAGADCASNEQCVDLRCAPLSCGSCEYAQNHQCNSYECCANTDCVPEEACKDNRCVRIECPNTHRVKDHVCVGIECNEHEVIHDKECVECKEDEIVENLECVKLECESFESYANHECRNVFAAWFFRVINRFVGLVQSPFEFSEMLWELIPLFILLVVMELYFGRYPNEELGWNTALANSVVLIVISFSLMNRLNTRGALFELSFPTIMVLTMLFLAISLTVLDFYKLLPKKLAFMFSSELWLNTFGVITIILVFTRLEFNVVSVIAILILVSVILSIVHVFKRVVHKEYYESPEDVQDNMRVEEHIRAYLRQGFSFSQTRKALHGEMAIDDPRITFIFQRIIDELHAQRGYKDYLLARHKI